MTEGHTRTVLVVDDANGLVEIYERWLNDDFRVLTATDGQTAISTADDTVDVVLIDRDLPKMSGSTVVEEIRNLGHDPAVVLLSSVEPDFDVVDVDCRACLTKPVMRRDLVDAVERAERGAEPADADRATGGPTLSDHAPRDDDAEPGKPDADPADDPGGTAGGDPRVGGQDPGGATTDDGGDENRDGDGDPGTEDDSEEDITARLRSLQSDLQETADELTERADDRPEEETDPVVGTVDEPGASFDDWDEPDDPDQHGDDAGEADAEDGDGEGGVGGGETGGGDAGEDEGTAEGPTDDEDSQEGDARSGAETTATPRDLLPDSDGSETDDGDEEPLQRRVERLASKATELAEASVEDADDDTDEDD